MKNFRKDEKGFTLVELAIVLIIIGLIVGGVLVGQDMIKAAEIRSTISQMEKLNTAVNVFRNKYSGIPGDMSNATNFFDAADIDDGDGNGLIEDDGSTATLTYDDATGELINVFAMLSKAGIVEGSHVNTVNGNDIGLDRVFPPSKIGRGGVAAFAVGGRNKFHLGIGSDLGSGATAFSPAVTPSEAFQIDSKMDDGNPSLGIVEARSGATPADIGADITPPGTVTATDCIATADTYNVQETVGGQDGLSCQLQFLMN